MIGSRSIEQVDWSRTEQVYAEKCAAASAKTIISCAARSIAARMMDNGRNL